MKISARIKSTESKTLNGFSFIAMDDGYAYAQIFPKQKQYISRIIKDVEFADYKEPVRRTRKKKVEPVE